MVKAVNLAIKYNSSKIASYKIPKASVLENLKSDLWDGS